MDLQHRNKHVLNQDFVADDGNLDYKNLVNEQKYIISRYIASTFDLSTKRAPHDTDEKPYCSHGRKPHAECVSYSSCRLQIHQ